MNLSFSTTWPDRMGGKPTHFVNKIMSGLDKTKEYREEARNHIITNGLQFLSSIKDWDRVSLVAPKIHTIRHDPHDRWKVGMKIHPVIHNRTPQRFQFAPTLVCTGVQEIEIKYVDMPMPSKYVMSFGGKQAVINMDGRPLTEEESQKLAINYGFESVEQFFQWFNEPFVGKLVHWTKLKY